MKQRINYFDLIKTVAIILVIYVHYSWTKGTTIDNLSLMICIIAVPLFFMVNGSLLLSKELNLRKHINKFLIIYISLIFWKLLIFLIFYLLGRVNFPDIISFLQYLLCYYNINGVPTEHFWFMYSLLKIYLIFPIIKLAIINNKVILKYLLITCLLLGFGIEFLNFLNMYLIKSSFLNISNVINTFSPFIECEFLFYFLFGYYLHNKFYETKLDKKALLIISLFILISIIGIVFIKIIQDGHIYGEYHGIINKYSKFSTLLLASSIFVLLAKLDLKNCKLIKFLGRKTMNIYCIHMMIAMLLIIYIYPKINISGFVGNSIKTILVIIISVIITESLSKIKPIKKILNIS